MGHIEIASPVNADSSGHGDGGSAFLPVTTPAPAGHQECVSHGVASPLFSKINRHGGARANSGGARLGSGPKPKAKPAAVEHRASSPRWYCLQTEARYELAAIHALLVEGFEIHFPTIVEDDSRVASLMYPGYGFVRLDLDAGGWQGLQRGDVSRVRRLLSDPTGMPVPVRRGFVERLIEEAGEAGFIDARVGGASDIEPGTTVRVVDGPFAGFDAVVTGTAGKWIKVTTLVFGREAPMTLPRGAVVKISA